MKIFVDKVTVMILVMDLCSAFKPFRRRRFPVRASFDNDEPESRIYRGWFIEPYEFPWMVKIKSVFPVRKFDGTPQMRGCGGALVHSEWVITARHCLTWNDPTRRGTREFMGPDAVRATVFLGSYKHFGEDGLAVEVDQAVGREDYGEPQCNSRQCSNSIFDMLMPKDRIFTNDIVLLHLVHPVFFSPKINPVLLPKVNKDYMGTKAFISGWGMEGNPNRRRSGVLKAAELQVVPSYQSPACWDQASYGKMCAKATSSSRKSGSVCPGDSGSPLVLYDPENGGWTLIGLLSNGAKRCFDEQPAVYTRVGDYLPWIYETIHGYQYKNHLQVP